MVDQLDEIAETFEHSLEEDDEIEAKLHEEIEFLLEEMTPREIREEVEDHSDEFQDLVDRVLEGIQAEEPHE